MELDYLLVFAYLLGAFFLYVRAGGFATELVGSLTPGKSRTVVLLLLAIGTHSILVPVVAGIPMVLGQWVDYVPRDRTIELLTPVWHQVLFFLGPAQVASLGKPDHWVLLLFVNDLMLSSVAIATLAITTLSTPARLSKTNQPTKVVAVATLSPLVLLAVGYLFMLTATWILGQFSSKT